MDLLITLSLDDCGKISKRNIIICLLSNSEEEGSSITKKEIRISVSDVVIFFCRGML
jgi:hypothetical protein